MGSASDSRFKLDSPVLLATAALALWGLAGCARLRLIDHCAVGSDSLGPYLAALSASWSHLPHPPNPESGDALWWMALPLVKLASSLSELLSLRLVLAGVLAPLAFFGAWIATRGAPLHCRWAAALAAGLLLALDPGLLDTVISGARSYAAPELMGVACLGLIAALHGARWGLGLGVVARLVREVGTPGGA